MCGRKVRCCVEKRLSQLEAMLVDSSYPTMWTLASRVLGAEAVRILDTLDYCDSHYLLSPVGAGWVVYLRSGLSEPEQELAIASALAEWVIATCDAVDQPLASDVKSMVIHRLMAQSVAAA